MQMDCKIKSIFQPSFCLSMDSLAYELSIRGSHTCSGRAGWIALVLVIAYRKLTCVLNSEKKILTLPDKGLKRPFARQRLGASGNNVDLTDIEEAIFLQIHSHAPSMNTFTFTCSLTRGGRWCTIDDFTTSFLHISLLSIAPWELTSSRSGHSLMSSSHLFLCLPYFLPLFAVPCKIVLARPDERETCPYHCNLRLFTMVSRKVFEGFYCLLDLGTCRGFQRTRAMFQMPRAGFNEMKHKTIQTNSQHSLAGQERARATVHPSSFGQPDVTTNKKLRNIFI